MCATVQEPAPAAVEAEKVVDPVVETLAETATTGRGPTLDVSVLRAVIAMQHELAADTGLREVFLADATMPGAVWCPGGTLNYAAHCLAFSGGKATLVLDA